MAPDPAYCSCSGKSNISLNVKLARLPEALMDYVILYFPDRNVNGVSLVWLRWCSAFGFTTMGS